MVDPNNSGRFSAHYGSMDGDSVPGAKRLNSKVATQRGAPRTNRGAADNKMQATNIFGHDAHGHGARDHAHDHNAHDHDFIPATDHRDPHAVRPDNTSHFRQLNGELVSDLREAFSLCDPDQDGEINKSDLDRIMRALGFKQSDQELDWIMELADLDGSGTINFVEFVTFVTQNITRDNNKLLFQETFDLFDTDHDGQLDRRELSRALSNFGANLSEDEVEALIVEADFDGDGEISLTEFIRIMQAGMFLHHRRH